MKHLRFQICFWFMTQFNLACCKTSTGIISTKSILYDVGVNNCTTLESSETTNALTRVQTVLDANLFLKNVVKYTRAISHLIFGAVEMDEWSKTVLSVTFPALVVRIAFSTKTWTFLDKFCFVSGIGRVTFNISYPKQYAVQKLYLYYDTPDQWEAAYDVDKTCSQKESLLRRDRNQIVNFTEYEINRHGEKLCEIQQRDGYEWYQCSGRRTFESIRERWWYMAIGNCNSSGGLYMEYSLTMTNGDREQFWFYHFSADEFYILPTDAVTFLIEMLLLVIAFVFATMLHSRQMLHTTYKLFMVCLVLECISLGLDCVAYARYASDGVGYPRMVRLAQLTRAASIICFQLLLILMAKGWTIVRGRISQSGQWKIFWFMTTYTFVYTFTFVWQIQMFDPAIVLYVYESPPGYVIVGLRIAGWVWFCYAIYTTLVQFPEKRNFYYAFSVTMTLWYWAGPIVIIVATHILDKWVREKVVNGIENLVAFFGFSVFLLITRPSAANRNFPYHVRTTQVDVVNTEEDDPDCGTVLPRNPYEVRYDSERHDVIFTVGGNHINRFTSANGRTAVAVVTDADSEHRSGGGTLHRHSRGGGDTSPSEEPLRTAEVAAYESSDDTAFDDANQKPSPPTAERHNGNLMNERLHQSVAPSAPPWDGQQMHESA